VRPFVPSDPIKAFYETCAWYARLAPVDGSGWGGYGYKYLTLAVPPIPPRPTNPEEAAFFDNVCMPLYNLLVQATGIGTAIVSGVTPAGTPYVPPPSPQVQELATALNITTEYAAAIIQQEQQAFSSGP
jgi:hypothetical protein